MSSFSLSLNLNYHEFFNVGLIFTPDVFMLKSMRAEKAGRREFCYIEN